MKFFSNDILHNHTIPTQFTCDSTRNSTNSNPHLAWSNLPPNTQSFAILIDDPDSPSPPNWCHLLLYNIPSTIHEIPHNSLLHTQWKFGWNSWDSQNYRGPCPPKGTRHKYIFHLYALDIILPENRKWTRDIFLTYIENHIIETAEFNGFYSRIK
jgi:Raf kinase inhibitor-like YbhB/YbcL family protein